jgi:hypothetical protein
MADEEARPKKARRPRRILRSIGIGLLALLIIAALLLAAPWKVITLLVVIFLACTVLPKPARKWSWTSVGLIVLVLIVWVFLPDNNEGWRPYTLDEELDALKVKYSVPDEENAAIIYDHILGDYNSETFFP